MYQEFNPIADLTINMAKVLYPIVLISTPIYFMTKGKKKKRVKMMNCRRVLKQYKRSDNLDTEFNFK